MVRVQAIEHKHRAPVIRTVVFPSNKGVMSFSVVEEWICRKPQPGVISGPLGESLAREKWRVQRLMLDERGRFILYSQGADAQNIDYSFPSIDQAREWLKAHKDAKALARLPAARVQAIAQASSTPKTGAEAA